VLSDALEGEQSYSGSSLSDRALIDNPGIQADIPPSGFACSGLAGRLYLSFLKQS
jgi:hypothetical protein